MSETLEVKEIPLSEITVEEGHNPRSEFDLKSIEELSQSIRTRGVLQPIVVRENGDGYILVAGERRLRACQGILETIPALVRNGRSEEQDERLVDALIENVQRKDISVADEVSAYRRLKQDHGWDAKRIAHETGFAQNRVTQRMALLVLPQDAIDAAAHVPERARKALVKLASLDSPGAGELAKWLATQADEVQADFGKAPSRLLRGFKCVSSVPFLVKDGYYDAQHFQLDKDASVAREKLDERGYGVRLEVTTSMVKQGEQLSSVVELADGPVIGGWEVCCQIAGRAFIKAVADTEKRKEEYDERNAEWKDTGGSSSQVVVDPETGKAADEERAKEIRKQRFAEQKAEREDAIAFNEALAAPLLQKGVTVKLTVSNARLLSFFALQAAGYDWAARGLRYIHPNGRLSDEGKVAKYVEGPELHKLLDEWIGAARKAEEILARTLTVIAAARLADDDAVAQSNKRGVGPSSYSGVFDEKVIDEDLDKLIRSLLPKQLLDRIEERAAASSPAETPESDLDPSDLDTEDETGEELLAGDEAGGDAEPDPAE